MSNFNNAGKPDFSRNFESLPPINITSGSAIFPPISNPGITSSFADYYQSKEPNAKTDEMDKEWAAYVVDQKTREKAQFKRQEFFGIVIFVLVILMVIFGLILTYMQFRIALIAQTSSSLITQSCGSLNTNISLSKDGITLNSSIVGAIVLFASLGFFYLFLRYVYYPKIQISNIGEEFSKYFNSREKK